MSRMERRALVEREALPVLPVSRQCRLLSVARASVYRRPATISAEDCTIMTLLDRQYLARPYYGSRREAAWLATQGHVVNRKRVQRLMCQRRSKISPHGGARAGRFDGVF